MNACIICHKAIEAKQMVKEGKKPSHFLSKKGKMHASCYKIFKVFMDRGAWLPVTLFVIGIVLMVLILIPGLITNDNKLIITSLIILGINLLVSLVWYWLMHSETIQECKRREPIKKKDDFHDYDADFRMKEGDYAIQEESFDYYHENIDLSQFEPEDLNPEEKWALNLLSLNPDFDFQELELHFQKLTNLYLPAPVNNYETNKIKELLKARKILIKSKNFKI